MKSDKKIMSHSYLGEILQENTEIADELVRRKQNKEFSQYEKHILNALESNVIFRRKKEELDNEKLINEEYHNLVTESEMKIRIEVHFEEEKNISKERIFEFLKKEISRAVRISKMKELIHLYQIKAEKLEKEQRYYDSIATTNGLSKVLDYVLENRFVSYTELVDVFKEKEIDVGEIIRRNEEYFYFTEYDKKEYVSLSGKGIELIRIRDKRADKIYSRSELEDNIYNSCNYILDCLNNNTRPSDIKVSGISSERQKSIYEKYKRHQSHSSGKKLYNSSNIFSDLLKSDLRKADSSLVEEEIVLKETDRVDEQRGVSDRNQVVISNANYNYTERRRYYD